MDAYSFLLRWVAKTHEPFNPEDVIQAAEQAGVGFSEKRAWGNVFLAAMKDGYIRRAGMFARATSNGSLRPGWVRA